jgi:hypothetical protein
MNQTRAWKLFRLRKNNSLGSLFINKRAVIPIDSWLEAADYPTKGYANRPGWHCTGYPYAPHLKLEGRVWREVEIKDYVEFLRPQNQGGRWFLAKWMKVLQ